MSAPSERFKQTFHVETTPVAAKENIVIKGATRFTVLTPRLLRVETNKNALFCDNATQAVLHRDFPAVRFSFEETKTLFILRTEACIFSFDKRQKKMQSVTLRGGKTVTDFSAGNLKGTYRTLDMVNGSCKLEDGLMSRSGVAVVDDTRTCVIADDGTIKPRPQTQSDLYFFAYGTDYRACLQDFFYLCGEVPLVPRYCLGNWWSRYKAYSQQEYLDLMQRFRDNEIPLTVATIDMDWHWVDVVERFGNDAKYRPNGKDFQSIFKIFQSHGWTGYSWNTELFPDYKALLRQLHDMDLKVTMNLHPAQGVRPFEDQYAEMARAMGIDPASKKHIPFDIADPKFCEAYFDVLHKPYEKDGVSFWWIDWQQEKTTSVPGLDPLWALNHYHTLSAAENGKRPLILSRFAEVGSHRYPLGFSGDTIITWKSLDFQPYFTATASNVGYTWWSHDIGGHQLGARDGELYARWVQYGLYSPIMRLHSTSDPFMGKEPWAYGFEAQTAATAALRERHAMIPYLYAMNRLTNKDGRALVEPMYYACPDAEDAYEAKNQYYFGTELMVRPVTEPSSKITTCAKAPVWLPGGRWTDIYTGYIYEGEGWVNMYRGLGSIPVLAKEGAILPLATDDRHNDWRNPNALTIRVWRGCNSFCLYEDDGETMAYCDGAFTETMLRVLEAGGDLRFTIEPCKGDAGVLPEKRDYTLVFEDVTAAKEITLLVGGKAKQAAVSHAFGKTTLTLRQIPVTAKVEVVFSSFTPRENKDKTQLVTEVLSRYQMGMLKKRALFSGFVKDITKPFPSKDEALRGPVEEILRLK